MLCYPLRHRGWDRGKARRKAMEILSLPLHIEELAERNAGRLSGGQQQRVALARAIIYDPCLLLLDEPFKGLEQELREQLLADICMHVRRGIGVLLVTHERGESESRGWTQSSKFVKDAWSAPRSGGGMKSTRDSRLLLKPCCCRARTARQLSFVPNCSEFPRTEATGSRLPAGNWR